MKVMSNAFIWQSEIVQSDRWAHGPLELALLPPCDTGSGALARAYSTITWNQEHTAGFVRSGDALENLKQLLPHIENRKNPNLIVVPTVSSGTSQLDVMLASLLPDDVLRAAGLVRQSAQLSLSDMGLHELPPDYGRRARAAFSSFVWTKLVQSKRFGLKSFAAKSSLRLLAGDPMFWMNRIYRIALDRREYCFDECDEVKEPTWKPLEEIRSNLWQQIPEEERSKFIVRRPLQGGFIWDPEIAEDREDILNSAIDGDGVLESIRPVVETLLSSQDHDDFSSRNSWIKEDFERSFYSKRAKTKVTLVETFDDFPVWAVEDNKGYEDVLFRDVLATLEPKERRIVIALRQGKRVSEISRDEGLAGHAAISRRMVSLKAKIKRLLA